MRAGRMMLASMVTAVIVATGVTTAAAAPVERVVSAASTRSVPAPGIPETAVVGVWRWRLAEGQLVVATEVRHACVPHGSRSLRHIERHPDSQTASLVKTKALVIR
jgi:hypothetical protein